MKKWVVVLLFLGLLAGGRAARSADPPPVPEVVIRANHVEGKLAPESITNAAYDAVYGQTVSTLADSAFTWIRASNALSYVRCYNWLGEGIPKSRPDWFSGCRIARKGEDGKPVYQWEGLERVLDTLVASGVKPVIVCAGMPDALIEGTPVRNDAGAAINRPADYRVYQDMITQLFRRMEKTYGEEEVRTWYFEVWSQPDHQGSWQGGRPAPFTEDTAPEMVEPFARLYDHFVAGATAVDEKVRLGGPGLAGDLSFLRHFLRHCASGTNAVTGKKGTRIDFVSWTRYGPVSDITRWNSEVRRLVRSEAPELKDLEFLLTECGSGRVEGARSNTSYEAARLAALLDANVHSEDPVDMIFRAGDLVDDHFDGFRPLITRVGTRTIPLPAFRCYSLLSKLGPERLRTEAPAGIGAIAARGGGKDERGNVQALLYRYDPSVLAGSGKPVKLRVRFEGLPGLFRISQRLYRIDPQTHADYEAWIAAGSPGRRPDGTPSDAANALGKKLGSASLVADFESPGIGIPVKDGKTAVDVELWPNSVVLVTLGTERQSAAPVCPRGERLLEAEEAFNAAAEFQAKRQFGRAIQALQEIRTKYADSFWRESALYTLIGLYEFDMKAPAEAERARLELLQLPIDDFTRDLTLGRLRVDAARKGETQKVAELSRQIAEIANRLAGQKRWAVTRYYGQ
jgi:xylan 1,4-beta-xylosidase